MKLSKHKIKINATEIGNDFLCYNNTLAEFNAPLLTSIGDGFMFHNETLKEFNAPLLTSVGHYFLYYNKHISLDI